MMYEGSWLTAPCAQDGYGKGAVFYNGLKYEDALHSHTNGTHSEFKHPHLPLHLVVPSGVGCGAKRMGLI